MTNRDVKQNTNPHLMRDRCEQIGLPEPHSGEEQIGYVRRLLMSGHSINTRQARFIGIHNLHSIAAELRRRLMFETEHRSVLEPLTGVMLRQPVDVLFMTPEQILLVKYYAPTEAEA